MMIETATDTRTRPIGHWTLFGRAMRRRCPQCGGKGFFSSWFKLNDHCPTCGIACDREDGHFVGAVGFNTIFSFGVLLITLLVGTWITYPHIPVLAMLGVTFAVAIVVPLLFWPFSQTLWMAFDLGWRPAREAELDPRYVDTLPAA